MGNSTTKKSVMLLGMIFCLQNPCVFGQTNSSEESQTNSSEEKTWNFVEPWNITPFSFYSKEPAEIGIEASTSYMNMHPQENWKNKEVKNRAVNIGVQAAVEHANISNQEIEKNKVQDTIIHVIDTFASIENKTGI